MKTLRNVLGLLIALAAAWLSGLILYAAVSGERWNHLTQLVARGRLIGACAAVAILCVLVIMGLTARRRARAPRILSFHNEEGTVSISTVAIEDYVGKLANEFPSVVRMQPVVLPRRGCIDVLVKVRVKAGPQIHEICEVLQRRVRETLVNGLGITEVRRVEVSVSEISPEHKSN